jgi:hypothetical protein
MSRWDDGDDDDEEDVHGRGERDLFVHFCRELAHQLCGKCFRRLIPLDVEFFLLLGFTVEMMMTTTIMYGGNDDGEVQIR